jgi:hypothetical protein
VFKSASDVPMVPCIKSLAAANVPIGWVPPLPLEPLLPLLPELLLPELLLLSDLLLVELPPLPELLLFPPDPDDVPIAPDTKPSDASEFAETLPVDEADPPHAESSAMTTPMARRTDLAAITGIHIPSILNCGS